MPYIKPEARKQLHDGREPETPGELNYLVTRMCDIYIGPDLSYTAINEVVGALECVKLELYRKLAAGYEDTKEAENGRVYRIRD